MFALDATAPTTDQVVHALDQLYGLGNATKLQFLRALDHLDRTCAFEEDGAASLEGWVAYRYAMPWKSASDHVKVIRALRDLPRIAGAFESGRICWEVVIELCSFVPSEEDEEWAERAQRLNAAQVQTWARRIRRLRREAAARVQSERYLHASWDWRGEFLRLDGLIPGAEGALVKKALDRICDELGPGPGGTFEPREKRLADALTELAGTYVAGQADPDRATVVVSVEARELSRVHGKGWLEHGPDIPSEVVRRLACDARLEVVVRDPGGRPIGMGRVSRVVPPALRRRLQERDEGCVVCRREAGCHAHHSIHWAHGGRTDLDNLQLLCRRCHVLVHDGGFRLVRDGFGNTRLVRPDGHPVRNRPMPLRPEVRERVLGPAPMKRRVPMRC